MKDFGFNMRNTNYLNLRMTIMNEEISRIFIFIEFLILDFLNGIVITFSKENLGHVLR